METKPGSPFGSAVVDEVPLANAPLVRVLAQVRYPRLVSMRPERADATVGRVVDRLGETYPILGEEHEVTVSLGPEGLSPTPAGRLWRLKNTEDNWQVTIGDAFVALDTTAYVSRGDFATRMQTVLEAVLDSVQPPYVDRVGIRYTNRIDGASALADLPSLVRAEMLGGLAFASNEQVAVSHTLDEALYKANGQALHARWGLLPANAQIDASLPPVPHPSWIFDLDSFKDVRSESDATSLAGQVGRLAEGAYEFFRWATTPRFLIFFGGAK